MLHVKNITHKFHKKRDCELIHLLQGEDRGYAAWYYVKFENKIKLALFTKRVETEPDDIQIKNYGEILKSGWGKEPPEHIAKKLEEEYLT